MQLLTQLALTAVVMTAAYGLVATGFSLILSVSKVFHFAHASTAIIPPYVYFTLVHVVDPFTAFLGSLVAGGAVALAVEFGVYRVIRNRDGSSLTALAASIGVLSLLQGVVGAVWGTTPIRLDLPLPSGGLDLSGVRIDALDIELVGIAAAVIAGVLLWLSRSRTGRMLLAVAEEPDVAMSVGISGDRARAIGQVIGTLTASLAFFYLGAKVGLIPFMGIVPLLFAFAGAVVGGLGRVGGSVLGVAVLLVVSTFAVGPLPTFWSLPVAFVVLAAFLLVRPTGIFGTPRRSTAR